MIGLAALKGRAGLILRVCGYLQGGVCLLLVLVTHWMGFDTGAALVGIAGIAGACYFAGAAGIRTRLLFLAAALLFAPALAPLWISV